MNEEELKERFRKFAIDVYHLTQQFPRESVYFNVEGQLNRCSSSAASNYRAACRGKSLADFINKLATVEEEIDESVFWLEYTTGVNKKWELLTKPLLKEGNELTAIIVSSIKTAKKRNIKLKTRY
jgi:four helix bundle protein